MRPLRGDTRGGGRARVEAEAVVTHLQVEGPEDAAAREAGEKR